MRVFPAALCVPCSLAALVLTALPAFHANFEDIAARSGLTTKNVFGGQDHKDYILETTGNGVAIFDFDGDGRNDIFIANGTRLPSAGPKRRPYRSSITIWATATSKTSAKQAGFTRNRLGARRLRRRLRQRRPAGPARHLLRP